MCSHPLAARVLLTVVTCAVAACSAAGPDRYFDTRALSQDPARVVGAWTLERGFSPWNGRYYSPQQNGRTQRYEFDADGTVRFFLNGTLVTQTSWGVVPECNEAGRCRDVLFIDTSTIPTWGVDERTLVLDLRALDGPAERYTRER